MRILLRLKGEDGMGLVEMLIASTLLALVVGLMVPLIGMIGGSTDLLISRSDTGRDVRQIFDVVVRDLRNASPRWECVDGKGNVTKTPKVGEPNYDSGSEVSIVCDPDPSGAEGGERPSLVSEEAVRIAEPNKLVFRADIGNDIGIASTNPTDPVDITQPIEVTVSATSDATTHSKKIDISIDDPNMNHEACDVALGDCNYGLGELLGKDGQDIFTYKKADGSDWTLGGDTKEIYSIGIDLSVEYETGFNTQDSSSGVCLHDPEYLCEDFEFRHEVTIRTLLDQKGQSHGVS